jgi:hypothetical protein
MRLGLSANAAGLMIYGAASGDHFPAVPEKSMDRSAVILQDFYDSEINYLDFAVLGVPDSIVKLG